MKGAQIELFQLGLNGKISLQGNLKEYRDKLSMVDLHISMGTRINGHGCVAWVD